MEHVRSRGRGDEMKDQPSPSSTPDVDTQAAIKAVATIGLSSSVSISMRNYFSYHHYFNARYFAAMCIKRERELAGKDRPRDPRHTATAMGAVHSAVAFMEAYINEFFQDAHDEQTSRLGALPEPVRILVGTLWAATEVEKRQLRTLDKYNLTLRLAGKALLPPGENPYQAAKRLIALRNYFIHYKPISISTSEPHPLEKELRGLFNPNALMVGMGNAWFPDHAIGAGMSSWAVSTAENLVDQFNARIGLDLDYRLQLASDDGSDQISLS